MHRRVLRSRRPAVHEMLGALIDSGLDLGRARWVTVAGQRRSRRRSRSRAARPTTRSPARPRGPRVRRGASVLAHAHRARGARTSTRSGPGGVPAAMRPWRGRCRCGRRSAWSEVDPPAPRAIGSARSATRRPTCAPCTHGQRRVPRPLRLHPDRVRRWLEPASRRTSRTRTQWLIAEHEGRSSGTSAAATASPARAPATWPASASLPEHRGRGLARALLLARFADDRARGAAAPRCSHVDATNPTGATQLYESVGMVVDSETVGFHRPLFDGS